MYPPLCSPAACEVEADEETAECFFDEKERDILEKPQKYKVRSALWDELKKLTDKIKKEKKKEVKTNGRN